MTTLEAPATDHPRRYRKELEHTRRSSPLAIFTHALHSSWRGTLAWMVAIAGVGTLYLSLYSSMADALKAKGELMKSFPPELMNALGGNDVFNNGPGYTQTTYLGLLGFVLLVVASVSWGGRAVAGQEESGDLELTLARGVSRFGFYLQHTMALLVRIVLLGVTATGIIYLFNRVSDLGIDAAKVPAGTTAYTLLGLLAGTIALAIGALSGRRLWAVGGGAAVAVIAYFLNALGSQSKDWDWLLDLSPYHWAYGHKPLLEGWDWQMWLVPALALVFWIMGAIIFNRRDLGR